MPAKTVEKEPIVRGPKPILNNKTAVQKEEIVRTANRKGLKEVTKLHKVLNEIIEIEESDEEQFQQNQARKSQGTTNRKGVVVREQANTVRTIPDENNGKKHQKKRYNTEPTWLDRYRRQHSDEELSEVSNDEDEAYPTPDMHSWYQAFRS